jgi:UDP-N-acetylglucosamine acyltransferase
VIVGNVEIGDENWIGPHVTMGLAAQYAGPRYELKVADFGPIRIGNRNTFRECATVHEPSKYVTSIEDDCYFMAYTHVPHDGIVRSKVTFSNNVQVGGFTEVQFGAVIGLSATIHQFTTVGAFCMVGMSSVVVKDLPPFSKWSGNPARFRGLNTVGLERSGFAEGDVASIARAYAKGLLEAPQSLAGHLSAFKDRNAQMHRPIASVL